MKLRTTIIVAAAMLVFVFVVIAMIVPSLPRYEFESIREATSFEQRNGDIIEDQFGDTNGSYRLKSAIVGGRLDTNFSFSATFDGRTTNWSRPRPNGVHFRATIFENRRGNQFAVVTKWTDSAP